MSILKDFKIPELKIPKINISKTIDVEELKKDMDISKEKAKKEEKKLHEMIQYSNIRETFDDVTTRFSDHTLFLEKFDKKTKFSEITYTQFREDVIGFGTGLLELLGLKDKPIVIIGENTYAWYVSYMSILCGVGIAVPVDKELPANEIINLIERSKAKAIIYSPKKKDVIDSIKDQLDIDYFIEMYKEGEILDKTVGMNYVSNVGKQMAKSGNNKLMNTPIDQDAFKILLFTSGTTSKSKGVMLSNKNLTENLYGALSYVYVDDKDRFFSVLPLHHTYESTIGFLVPFAKGASVAICQGLKYIVQDLQETKPTLILAVPALAENLYKKINANIRKGKKENLVASMIHVTNALKSVNIDIKRKVFSEIYAALGGNLRILVNAAAPIDKKIGKWFEDIGISFLQGYGLTETAPIAALTPDFKPKVGSVGKPVICAQVKIDNPNEQGEGEILIKSTTLMLGYYEDEELTKQSVIDGWFHSGDVGYVDEEGYIFITGRIKNVIVAANGKNVYPEELELTLSQIPYIKESMVYGLEDGKDIKIAVKITLNTEYIEEKHQNIPTKEEIHQIVWNEIKEINKTQVPYKAIKHLEIKDKDFIKTTTMKIKRYEELKNK